MKVKIKKQGKVKTYSLIKSWSDVTLERWIELIKAEKGSKSEEAEETIAALSDIPNKLIKELSIRDVAIIISNIAELQSKQDTVLKKIIEIDGVEYGMHPNLDDLTLGEYADIETFIKNGIEGNMPELMAILFRPVVEKKNKAYVIEGYDGDITIRAEIMKKMTAEQVQNCLVFFYHFGKKSAMTLPSFLVQRTQEVKKELEMEILRKDGVGSE